MVPLSYNYRNLLVRWKTTIMTAGGFTLVVAALSVMLAFVDGIRAVCNDSGEPANVVVLAKGNSDEVLSRVDDQTAREVEHIAGIKRGKDGRPLISRELFLVVTQPTNESGIYKMLQVRGLLSEGFQVHSRVSLVEGRRFRSGRNEVIVGRLFKEQAELELGSQVELGRKKWTVVGVFEAAGSVFESEIWCHLQDVSRQFRREGSFSSLVVRAQHELEAPQLARRIASSNRISVEAQTETEHFAKQAEQTDSIHTAGIVIAVFMAIGAVFGITNTMFAAINQRTKDIAVLRMLGYRRGEIMISFLLEALLIAFVGGLLGIVLGYGVNGLTLEFSTGAKAIAFAFVVNETTVAWAAAFTLGMGLVGGLLPAWSAMRVNPLESLR